MKQRQPRPREFRQAILIFAALGVLIGVTDSEEMLRAQPAPQSINVEARGNEIIAHLNAMIRLYRASAAPVQKAGEPNDVIYRDQAVALSAQAANLAFEFAKAESTLLAQYQSEQAPSSDAGSSGEQRLQAAKLHIAQQLAALKAREADLDREIAKARPKEIDALQSQRKEVESALDLNHATSDAVQKILSITEAQSASGFSGDIDHLQRSVPELDSKTKIVAPQLTTLDEARSSGVSSQAGVLIQLLETKHALDLLIQRNNQAHAQAQGLQAPIAAILQTLIKQGRQLTQAAIAVPPAGTVPSPQAAPASPASGDATTLETVTKSFKAVSTNIVPLSQELIVLEQNDANLKAWQTAVDREYDSVLQTLLLRLLVIATALLLIFGVGEVWRRATNKYIRDIRRRRQILIVRRTVVGLLSGLVLVFGFVTQFNSLATFAGFITAGIAVGLQTILLSVAAYFFIIGKYGVKVGDRVTVAGVTGDVIDVGLVRFYMMELAGQGTDLNPTGRVVVFSNAVLFQAGTPLYKQLPGTEYAWHELIVKLSQTANYKAAIDAILKLVDSIYEQYRASIEEQHQAVERSLQASMESPTIHSRVQFADGGLQLLVRFPVEMQERSRVTEQLTKEFLGLMQDEPGMKDAITAVPVIQASVKG